MSPKRGSSTFHTTPYSWGKGPATHHARVSHDANITMSISINKIPILCPFMCPYFNWHFSKPHLLPGWFQKIVQGRNTPAEELHASYLCIYCRQDVGVKNQRKKQNKLKPNKIKSSQRGFIRCKLFLTDLLEFFEDASGSVDRGELVHVMCLELPKTSAIVTYKRLVLKWTTQGFGESVFAWIENCSLCWKRGV